jgi:tetratricopeptide (TPR) repeat protein
MNVFSNLCPHESILLVLGVVLFSVLIFLIIWKTVKEQKIGILFPFFLLPVVMIAYPTIGSVQYNEGKFQFNTLLAQYLEGTMTDEGVDEFREKYQMLSQSCKSNHDSGMLTTFAQAQLATGNYEEAALMAERTLNLRPDNRLARDIQQRSIQLRQQEQQFGEKTSQLQSIITSFEEGRMSAERANHALKESLSEIELPQNMEPGPALTVAKALSYAGHRENALELVNRILETPGLNEQVITDARQLRSDINSGRLTLVQETANGETPEVLNVNPELTREVLNQQRFRTWIWTDRLRENP